MQGCLDLNISKNRLSDKGFEEILTNVEAKNLPKKLNLSHNWIKETE